MTSTNTKPVLLYKTVGGSRLYNLADENSDEDFEGVAFPPLSRVIGIGNHQNARFEKIGKTDVTLYSIFQFGGLLNKANFKVLEILHAPDDKVITVHPAFQPFLDAREELLHDVLLQPLLSFAKHQMNKLHQKPVGGVRRRLFDELGYDSKYLMHCIRCLLMGYNYIKGEGFNVDMTPYRDKLLAVKYGKISESEGVEWANSLRAELVSYLTDNYEFQYRVEHSPDLAERRDKVDAMVIRASLDVINELHVD